MRAARSAAWRAAASRRRSWRGERDGLNDSDDEEIEDMKSRDRVRLSFMRLAYLGSIGRHRLTQQIPPIPAMLIASVGDKRQASMPQALTTPLAQPTIETSGIRTDHYSFPPPDHPQFHRPKLQRTPVTIFILRIAVLTVRPR